METLFNAITWFEIPVRDFDRAKKFYSAIYDFKMTEMQMDNNRMGMFTSDPNGVGGCICLSQAHKTSRDGVRIYLSGGDDLTVVLNRVAPAGGTVITPKTAIPEMGFYALFEDTEGNLIGLHSMG